MVKDTGDATAGDTSLYHIAGGEVRLRAVGDTLMVIVGVLLAASVLTVGVGDLLNAVGITTDTHPVLVNSAETAMNFVGFLTAGLTYLYWRDDWTLVRARFPTLREAGIIVLGTLALAGTVQGLGMLAEWIGLETAENVSVQAGQEHPELLLVFIPMQFLLVAPAEELIFRGLLQGLFRRAYGIVPGIVIAAAVFGLIHYPALVGEQGVWVVIAILALSGALLGALYEYTRNLSVSIVVHAVWNTFLYAVLYVETTGGF